MLLPTAPTTFHHVLFGYRHLPFVDRSCNDFRRRWLVRRPQLARTEYKRSATVQRCRGGRWHSVVGRLRTSATGRISPRRSKTVAAQFRSIKLYANGERLTAGTRIGTVKPSNTNIFIGVLTKTAPPQRSRQTLKSALSACRWAFAIRISLSPCNSSLVTERRSFCMTPATKSNRSWQTSPVAGIRGNWNPQLGGLAAPRRQEEQLISSGSRRSLESECCIEPEWKSNECSPSRGSSTTSTTTAATTSPKRLAIPSAELRGAALEKIREILKDDYTTSRTSPAKKEALVKQLLSLADEESKPGESVYTTV